MPEEPVLCPYVKFTAPDGSAPPSVHRRQVRNCPYNPRFIREGNRAKLRAAIERTGLLTALVWNRRTGNIVGGNQRLAVLDQLMRTDNYLVPVDVVDMDEGAEKAACVLLNNHDLMGEFDDEGMEKLIREGLDLDAAGIDAADVVDTYGEEALASGGQDAKLAEIARTLREAQERYDAMKEASTKRDNVSYYRVVVFPDQESAGKLARLLERPGEIFLPGPELMRRLSAAQERSSNDRSE